MNTGNRISVSTLTTLHNPVEVEIDGVVYVVRMNRLIFQKLKEFEESFRTVSLENPNYDPIFILYDEVELMTGAKREVVEKLDFNDLKQIVEFIMQKYYGRKAPEIVAGESVSSGAIPLTPEQEEKNRLEPGVAQ